MTVYYNRKDGVESVRVSNSIDLKAEVLAIYEDWKVANQHSLDSGEGHHGVMIDEGVYDSFNNLMYAILEKEKSCEVQ